MGRKDRAASHLMIGVSRLVCSGPGHRTGRVGACPKRAASREIRSLPAEPALLRSALRPWLADSSISPCAGPRFGRVDLTPSIALSPLLYREGSANSPSPRLLRQVPGTSRPLEWTYDQDGSGSRWVHSRGHSGGCSRRRGSEGHAWPLPIFRKRACSAKCLQAVTDDA